MVDIRSENEWTFRTALPLVRYAPECTRTANRLPGCPASHRPIRFHQGWINAETDSCQRGWVWLLHQLSGTHPAARWLKWVSGKCAFSRRNLFKCNVCPLDTDATHTAASHVILKKRFNIEQREKLICQAERCTYSLFRRNYVPPRRKKNWRSRRNKNEQKMQIEYRRQSGYYTMYRFFSILGYSYFAFLKYKI